MTPLEALLASLPSARKAGKGWSAQCPAHEDRRASLSIAEGSDGTALVKCHAGCEASAILSAIGLKLPDLFPPKSGPHPNRNGKPKPGVPRFRTANAALAELERRHGKRSALWTYHDAAGNPVGLVVRWDRENGKDIRPIAKHSDGWRISAMPEPRPLYCLPKLAAASLIVITEGEKAADGASSLGFTATTSAGGALAAGKTDWRPLAGKQVWIFPDNNRPGRKFGGTVWDILEKLTPAPMVRIIELPGLPEGGDIVDWIDAHGDAAEPAGKREEIEQLALKVEMQKTKLIEQDWPVPQPIPDDLPSVKPFDHALLPESFVSFVSDVSERMQCPPDFPAVAMMIVLAGVVGKKIGIRPKRHDDWLVVPNLWGAVIGRPGVMKTPAIRQPIKFLQRLEIEAKKDYAKALAEYEVKLLIAEEQKRQRKEAVAKAIKDGKNPEKTAREIVIETPKAPVPRRYIINDSTVEKVGDLLNKNPNGLTVFRDEIAGLLEHLDKEGQEGARAFYIEAWDGLGRFTYDRIQRGTVEIESVTLSILGGIQPGKLSNYLRSAVQGGADDDGLMQRLQLSVYPDVNKSWRNIDRWPDTEAKQKVWAVLQTMDTLDPLIIGAENDGDAPYLRFDREAQNLFDEWRAELEPRIRSGEEHPAIESHLAKYRSLVPSLALLIYLADSGVGPVTAAATQKALAWVRYLESHARRIFSIVIDPTLAATKALAKRIMKGDVRDGFALRSVYRNAWAGLDKQSSELAADLLVELGWLKGMEITTGGRSKVTYQINPKILAKTGGEGTDKTDKSPPDDPSGSFGSGPPTAKPPGSGGKAALFGNAGAAGPYRERL